MEFKHISVLLQECIDALHIRPEGVYVDGTAGGGGHSFHIAEKLQGGRLIALDKDPDAINAASERLREFTCAQVVRSDFADVCGVLDSLGIAGIDGILLDLGVSSYQMDTPGRGFSYQHDAKLDMRMSQTGLSAYDIVNTYEARDLARILREFGEERFSSNIAANIVKYRSEQPLETTHQLMDIVKASIPAKFRRDGGNPAKRTFQAIRIAVNSELDSLSRCLDSVFDRLNPSGRIAVITFHSLEDRMVKQKFAALAKGCTCPPDFPICVCGNEPKGKLITRKPIEPTALEIEQNNRSRSAKLRVIEKL
ncbi:16S rRNA (cytosine(1402)-N(4))-methyltransferase RsmH [Candidatus Soleaferrea massiliensis]|uniref:16S rRNA (cytosine(1402)-N(4))-methyltransferase RsmH n=1 Tax=Candidatus Soleaferrea massiliensis TaxID=1470354 RepID=UPI00058CDD6B|nr:16S rRNA (cytosine(1402)-N(4))-methyltransferase RsmH [Candidatus Soleaferrea massiliensis]